MTPKSKELDITFQKIANKARFEFYVGIYNALRLQCEKEYDIFMNRDIWVVVAEPFCDRTHSQYGIVAIVRALMVVVNKEIWKAFLDSRLAIFKKDAGKRKKKETDADNVLKKKQMTAREQCIEMIGEEFTKKWETLPPELKMVMAGVTKTDFTKQSSQIHTFKVGSSQQKKKKPQSKQYPKQQTQATNLQLESENVTNSQNDSQRSEQHTTFKNNKQDFVSNKKFKGQPNSNFSPPSFRQQKHFFKHFENQNSRRPSFRSGGTIDPYSPDVAPMNIFENQVIPTGMHNLSKIFRPNLATLRVISLGMKFIPKSNTLKWRNIFSNFGKFRQRMNNKMFFFVENTRELLFGTKLFG